VQDEKSGFHVARLLPFGLGTPEALSQWPSPRPGIQNLRFLYLNCKHCLARVEHTTVSCPLCRHLIKTNNFNRDLSGRLPNKSYDTKLAFGVTLDEVLKVLKANDGRESMFHLIWYILIGLISGVIAKSVMHVHLTMFWTIVLGVIGSILGGAVTHVFSRPKNERYHPAGLILSTLGAILVLYICYKLKIHFPQV
jgi:uncharacterized membrane protein YeaQ/YmgE (transglycosylase-associated protein family)